MKHIHKEKISRFGISEFHIIVSKLMLSKPPRTSRSWRASRGMRTRRIAGQGRVLRMRLSMRVICRNWKSYRAEIEYFNTSKYQIEIEKALIVRIAGRR